MAILLRHGLNLSPGERARGPTVPSRHSLPYESRLWPLPLGDTVTLARADSSSNNSERAAASSQTEDVAVRHAVASLSKRSPPIIASITK